MSEKRWEKKKLRHLPCSRAHAAAWRDKWATPGAGSGGSSARPGDPVVHRAQSNFQPAAPHLSLSPHRSPRPSWENSRRIRSRNLRAHHFPPRSGGRSQKGKQSCVTFKPPVSSVGWGNGPSRTWGWVFGAQLPPLGVKKVSLHSP